MSSFTSPLRIEDVDERSGRQWWKVIDDFRYEIGAEGSGLIIHVPYGFETDFASVPRFFWRVLPPWGKYGKAAVVHDFLYRKSTGFSKVVADAIFYEAMEVVGVPWWKRFVMFWAVTLFGHSAFQWEAPGPGATPAQIKDGA